VPDPRRLRGADAFRAVDVPVVGDELATASLDVGESAEAVEFGLELPYRSAVQLGKRHKGHSVKGAAGASKSLAG
jgi:hypothetical protein